MAGYTDCLSHLGDCGLEQSKAVDALFTVISIKGRKVVNVKFVAVEESEAD